MATGSTVQNDEAARRGRMMPLTTATWPAAWSREPTRSLNRAAVAWVTATGTAFGGPCGTAPPGSEPATSLVLRPSPLR